MNAEQLAQLKKNLEREPYVLEWSIEGVEDLEHTHSPSIALLGEDGDGVRFSLSHRPTCYRRGPWSLLIEVLGGPGHHRWGCFDEADQPMRNYHLKESLLKEADAIARVLIVDRIKCSRIGSSLLYAVTLPGDRVRLIRMGEDSDPIPLGTEGTVSNIDDAGRVHINWDNGRNLALIAGTDKFRII